MAGNIDWPGRKVTKWLKLHRDLAAMVDLSSYPDHLMCPTCGRLLPINDFSIEHVLPRQAVGLDPQGAKLAVPEDERSETTLLCCRMLPLRNGHVIKNGCNGWKGKTYDPFLRKVVTSVKFPEGFTQRHHIAVMIAGFVALFERYGYSVIATPQGALMRRQFFTPNKFCDDMPMDCQILLGGQPLIEYDESAKKYWARPFSFESQGPGRLLAGFRNVSFFIPVERDPDMPVARRLIYVPPKYRFRPVFDNPFD